MIQVAISTPVAHGCTECHATCSEDSLHGKPLLIIYNNGFFHTKLNMKDSS